MLYKVLYSTDGIELFNHIFLKTPTMYNIFENQDSLFKIIDFILSVVKAPVAIC